LQSDPVGLNGGDNVYIYTENNPLNLMDTMGLLSSVDACAVPENVESCIEAGMVSRPVGAATAKPVPVPIPIPNEKKDCAKCTDYPYNRYILCEKLYMYKHNSFSSAHTELRMLNGGVNINRGPNVAPTSGPCSLDSGYAVGQHISFKYQGGRAGSLVSCECCEQLSDGVKIKEKWAVIP
jgi:hypothetical protein